LELSKLVVIVTDGSSILIGSRNCTVYLLYRYINEFGLHNELMQYNCINHQRNLIGKVLEYKQVMRRIVPP